MHPSRNRRHLLGDPKGTSSQFQPRRIEGLHEQRTVANEEQRPRHILPVGCVHQVSPVRPIELTKKDARRAARVRGIEEMTAVGKESGIGRPASHRVEAIATGSPPVSATRKSGLLGVGLVPNRITPSRFHAPPTAAP